MALGSERKEALMESVNNHREQAQMERLESDLAYKNDMYALAAMKAYMCFRSCILSIHLEEQANNINSPYPANLMLKEFKPFADTKESADKQFFITDEAMKKAGIKKMKVQSITTKSYDAIYRVTDESGTREVKRTVPWCAQFVINSDREGYEEKLRAIFNKAQKTDVQAHVISIRVFTDTVKLETVDFFADGKIKQVEKLPRGKMAGNTEEDE